MTICIDDSILIAAAGLVFFVLILMIIIVWMILSGEVRAYRRLVRVLMEHQGIKFPQPEDLTFREFCKGCAHRQNDKPSSEDSKKG